MRKATIYFFLIFCYSCSKLPSPSFQVGASPGIEEIENEKFKNRNIFASAFSQAINSNPSLRTLLKELASKRFNGTSDVLYYDFMNGVVNGKIVNDCIKEFASDKASFQKAVDNSPLLTIYVPKLPSGWQLENWDPQNQLVNIAVAKDLTDNKRILNYYDEGGKLNQLSDQLIPGKPTLVIKENARVILKPQADLIKQIYSPESDMPIFYRNINGKDFFILSKRLLSKQSKSKSYNNLIGLPSGNAANKLNPTSLDQIAVIHQDFDYDWVNAYLYFGTMWPRDFLYYGLTPTNTTGFFNNRRIENMMYLWFESAAVFPQISSESTDPHIIPAKFRNTDPSWTSGSYLLTFTLLVNAKNGIGLTVKKLLAINPEDVWDVTYEFVPLYNYYKYKSIKSKGATNVNLDLLSWDISNYSLAWKISVEVTRPTETQTFTNSYTSTFSQNFTLDPSLGILKKIGLKLGASATQSSTQTHTILTTYTSVQLGDMVMQFQDPILLNGGLLGPYYDYSTGLIGALITPQKQW